MQCYTFHPLLQRYTAYDTTDLTSVQPLRTRRPALLADIANEHVRSGDAREVELVLVELSVGHAWNLLSSSVGEEDFGGILLAVEPGVAAQTGAWRAWKGSERPSYLLPLKSDGSQAQLTSGRWYRC